ncbi:MAG TPA: hypothetical protein DEV81_21385 [Cyanobacteria bacterium UBA11049]|nr:hypothetical protein [Cyanobacteria bacterium UBA11049]
MGRDSLLTPRVSRNARRQMFYIGKDVYILTSKETFSAAESFTYTLKNWRQATIIGKITGGSANCGNHR